jgi:hypothetical protein
VTICSFPTSVGALIRIGPDGQVKKHFVNYGHLRPLNEVHTPSGSYLVAGGTNNEYNTGILAVLDEKEPAGRSPQNGSRSECDACPTGEPFRYFLFPRSEVNQIIGPPYNSVFAVLITNAQIQAMTLEVAAGNTSPPADWGLYSISESSIPESVAFSDDYSLMHERLRLEGKIHHTLADCPERLKPIVVREWSALNGWTTIALPPIAGQRKRAKE